MTKIEGRFALVSGPTRKICNPALEDRAVERGFARVAPCQFEFVCRIPANVPGRASSCAVFRFVDLCNAGSGADIIGGGME